jgi:hypothetical protein
MLADKYNTAPPMEELKQQTHRINECRKNPKTTGLTYEICTHKLFAILYQIPAQETAN